MRKFGHTVANLESDHRGFPARLCGCHPHMFNPQELSFTKNMLLLGITYFSFLFIQIRTTCFPTQPLTTYSHSQAVIISLHHNMSQQNTERDLKTNSRMCVTNWTARERS